MSLTSRCVCPVSPPKIVHPLCVASVPFEQVLSNELHNTLVIQPIASKKVSAALLSSKLAKPTKPLHQPSHTDVSDVKSKIVTLLHTSNSVTASHDMSSNNSIIVQGTCKKMHTKGSTKHTLSKILVFKLNIFVFMCEKGP